MSIYLVSYDLVDEKKNANHDYKILWDELKRLKAHRTNYSLWLVNMNKTPRDVLVHFRKFVDANDRVWIAKLFNNEYTFANAMAGTNKWLENNPPEAR